MPEQPPESPRGPVALAPGLRVVRRGRDRLQVGLTPPRSVVLPRTEQVRDVLHALLAGQQPAPGADTAAVLDRLSRAGCLVRSQPAAAAPAVAVRRQGAAWPDPLPRLLGDLLPHLLQAAGLRETPWERDADVVLLLCGAEPRRALLDPLLRDGTPHLVVTLADGGARLGPLVDPGRTACLRCVDAHLADDDPEHLAVLERYVEIGAAPRGDGDDGPADAALASLVVGWAVRELAAHLRGAPASTWSSTLTWHREAAEPVRRRWLRRPGCGCGWAVRPVWPRIAAHPSGTMEA